MKRVLHYGLSGNLGGIETYIKMLYAGIHNKGYVYDFLVTDGVKPIYYEEFKEMGSNFYWMTPRSDNPIKNYKDIQNIFKKNNIDILHCHLNTLSYITPIRVALKFDIPVIVQSHSSSLSDSFITRKMHNINKKRLYEDKIKKIAVSEKAGEWLFKNEDYAIINNGIDIKQFRYSPENRAEIRREFNLKENEYVIIHVGSFKKEKNHKYLLSLFKEFNDVFEATRLMLVGEGSEKEKIGRLVENLSLENRVIFAGNRNDVSSLFSASDLFLLPSIFEGFPIVAMEAQATGIDTIISSRVTDEVKVNTNCIFIDIDHDDSEDFWVEQMKKFYEENLSEKRRELAYKNIIKANLTQEDTVEDIKKQYESVLKVN